MWKMPEIILISRGNSELPIGLLLQVYSWVVYSVPHGTLSEGLRYIIFDLYKELELTKRSKIEQDKLVFNLIRASLKQNNLLLNGVIKYKNFENNIDQNDDY